MKKVSSNKNTVESQLKDLQFAVEELTLMVEALQEALEASPRVVYLPSQPIIVERPVYPQHTPWYHPNYLNQQDNRWLCGDAQSLSSSQSAVVEFINQGGLQG